MKFSTSVDSFANYLTKLSYVIPSRSTLPILDNILFELDGNELIMHATDLENFIRARITVEGIENGSCAIPAKKLLELTKLLQMKFEAVSIDIDFEKSDFELLKNEANIISVFSDKLKYLSFEQKLIHKGFLYEEDKNNIIEALEKNQESIINQGKHDIASKMELLKSKIEDIYEKSNKLYSKMSSKKKLTISTNEKFKIQINSVNGKYSVLGESPDDYPVFEGKNELKFFTLKSNLLKHYIAMVKHATDSDDLKRNMSGILFDVKTDEFRLVATDGFRLARIIYKDFSSGNENEDQFIVPSKTADLLTKLLEGEDIRIDYDETILKLSTDSIEIYSKLIDDKFPNYETVIPKNNDKQLKVTKLDFTNSLRRASIFVDPPTKRVKLEIKNSVMQIKADNPEIGGEGEEIIDCRFISLDDTESDFDKEPFSISFNVFYLLDAMSIINSPDIIMTFSSSSKASIILPTEQPENEEFVELVMPVRVS